jgi:hypothetical protein
MVPVELLEPDAAPLTRLMSALGSTPATNPKIEWLENEAMPRITTLTASAASNATTLAVAADIFRAGDVLRITAGGWALLVTATAANSVSGTKVGGTAQASAANAAEVYLVSNSNAEGALLREIKYPQLVTASNYCQILRTPVGLTETEQATRHYSGDERRRLQREAGIEHARAQEQTFFFGARDITGTQRLCGGLKEFIATNITNDTGGLTEGDLQTFLQSGFRYGAGEKVLFCSSKVIAAIEGFARSNLRVNDNAAAKYGVSMQQYTSGQGTINLVHHRDWQDSSVYGGYGFLVDMSAVKKRPLRDTRLKENVQAPDYDGFKDEYITETSFMVQHERRAALLTGVT